MTLKTSTRRLEVSFIKKMSSYANRCYLPFKNNYISILMVLKTIYKIKNDAENQHHKRILIIIVMTVISTSLQ